MLLPSNVLYKWVNTLMLKMFNITLLQYLFLGKSSGWPDDVNVLRCMKCEFYIRLSELLESECNIISTVTLDYLDIFYEGLVFRIRLFVPKELMLLKKIVDNEGIISYKDNKESVKLERELEILPKITSALSG